MLSSPFYSSCGRLAQGVHALIRSSGRGAGLSLVAGEGTALFMFRPVKFFAVAVTGRVLSAFFIRISKITDTMIYGYIRVSSDKQTTENQRYEIAKYCRCEGLGQVDLWTEETVSGTTPWPKRELGVLLGKMVNGDVIVATELSRLGRNLYMIMEILNLCLDRGIEVRTVKDNFRLANDIPSKVLAFAFGLSAEIERNLISQRTREALARRRSEGVSLGRPRGSRNNPGKYKLSGCESLIKELLSRGEPLTRIALKCGVSRKTVSRFIVRMSLRQSGR